MDDEWDDDCSGVVPPPPPVHSNLNTCGEVVNSRGRGFTTFTDEENEDGVNKFGSNGFGERRGRGGFRGRGGRGGGRGGGRDRRDGDSNGGYENGDRGDRGERGERGRGRGGRGGGRGGEEGEEGKKPPVTYVPPEPTLDEHEIFSSAISSGINFDKLDCIRVKVTGENPPRPIDSFETANLRKFVLDNILKSGYTKPTPIQKQAIPIIMDGRDLMGCAQTGSGKTAAFLLPIINMLLQDNAELVNGHCSQPQVVIVAPTRELTLQIFNEARKFAYGSVLKIAVAYGGTAVRHQTEQIARGCHILVATPGRLQDFVDRNRVSFESIRFVVLDEADRMLDMGFMPAVEKIMDHSSMVACGQRQTLMFSATFPEDIQHLAGRFLNNYLFVAVGIVGGASADVEQIFHLVSKYEKREMLKKIVEENDIKKVDIVLNYDLPKSIDEYVHRIGRTGRVGNRGMAVSFYDPDIDAPLSADLAKILRQAEQPVPDFLEGGGGTTSFKANKYGGSDIRHVVRLHHWCLSRRGSFHLLVCVRLVLHVLLYATVKLTEAMPSDYISITSGANFIHGQLGVYPSQN
ncbi:unnamed protein product [Leptidea sinapis]|uniref:RNA helicase n=1 Tax=Leptidea sinapis TaxID=189913 RepID=A0A5E4R502_9NEOP|nr:unnamed protein product [Leptidea sinapis]